MKAKVTKTISLEDGMHFGEISKFDERLDPYHYIDVYLKEKESGMEIKTGFPATISPTTGLGKFLRTMGIDVDLIVEEHEDDDEEYDLDELMNPIIGKKVTFQTLKEETEKGTFSKVVTNSIKLAR
jgi:beta-lactamase superfamily II metal-dependent hydrolase